MGAPDTDADRRISEMQQNQQELTRRVEGLASEVANLRRQVSSQQQWINSLQRSPVAEKDTASGEMTGSPPSPFFSSPEKSTAVSPTSATELYLTAFSDYASGRYSQAIEGFQEFLRAYPDNEYAGNAQYWIGECYYAQQDYEQAAAAFRQVAENFPDSVRAPEALFKAATALQRQGRPDQAREVLRILRQRYPQSDAAQKEVKGL